MASGSSGRANSGSNGFDFASADILYSYEDYNINQDSSNGGHSSDPVVGSNSSKDFHKSTMTRLSVFPATSYGISSRLSQLEVYCYNLDKSIGEMQSDLSCDHGEEDLKLKSLEKHLQEVHRSIQILRDKQELADTPKELAKLQLVQKESSSSTQSQSNEDKSSPSASDAKKTENFLEMHNQQLALALAHQVAPQQQPVVLPSQPAPQNVIQQQPYYLSANQLPTPVSQTQHPQSQYLPSDSQYWTPPIHEISRIPQPAQSQVNQTPPIQPFPQYQLQWPQQSPQQVPPPQQPSIQPQVRPQSSIVYPPYSSGQPTNASPERLPSSMPMQVSFSSVPPVSSCADAMLYGYTGASRTGPQQPSPQQVKVPFGAQPGDGYGVVGPHQGLPPPGSAYMMYDSEGARAHHPARQPHFPQGEYTPANLSLQNPQPSAAAMVRNPNHSQFVRNHPYNELIEKLMSLGFSGDHVVSVIQRMEESGQHADFNSVFNRLIAKSSGVS
ncbi:activating signal cointegrator 1 complex subunit 2 homolog isoform X2 [Tripterygium wilfordii]|uniref:activating signal cointegrator 1 complex subunit 2 homolog isoform X2 n=1 Tax=Tripterygium wilfordii TaxID=458696 RepID=UPI0018F849FF|nr:activating signal cointegrator 1 complex subunit 2 homolog isoform X2 [Tripterygium wilfordii]